MSNSIVGEVYHHVILDVIANSRSDFEENGVDDATLRELQNLWQSKLVATDVATFPWAQAPVGTFPIGQLFDPVSGLRTDSLDVTAPAVANSPILNNIAAIRAVQQMDTFAQQHGNSNYYSPPTPSLPQSATNISFDSSAIPNVQSNPNNTAPFPSYSSNSLQLPTNQTADSPIINDHSTANVTSTGQEHAPDSSSTNSFGGLLLPNQNSPKKSELGETESSNTTPANSRNDVPQTDGAIHDLDDAGSPSNFESNRFAIAQKADAEIYEVLKKNRILQIDGTIEDNEDEKKPPVDTPSDEAINSDLDDPDSDEAPETEEGSDIGQAIVLCLYDKVNHHKNKWKCVFRDGVVGVNGKDYLFFKANGEFEWI
ncbi:transcription factor TFIIA complex large subunit Toa1 [Schizosaccharomyces pombe]|uniref:Transcription initiation factor IIA large subunit n=1 Tax=Schizosaccharomyces pombe (strain 972 / ATCC 24843) TaxID=284812 RepID=TOA1_SCHPO|nr:putative transcription factor TFIIA complex large subunit Toa1 [Schizosaccharomyces pombe]Q9USU9.1 RecName: Full=Transcription initiation factor IIA large subunit; Short=TFIIA large subunit [Schizosaccharomyces pombe 972h-]CAB57938.1 transcription factor TFIIA complex large subunit Toa1 (predicted) [Schizosaccharomyces pombe]|eukprot:NP_595670.1 putative transcription factor TFIIA complex large subunit Toa1 [Schizosaccharomyces pombe]